MGDLICNAYLGEKDVPGITFQQALTLEVSTDALDQGHSTGSYPRLCEARIVA